MSRPPASQHSDSVSQGMKVEEAAPRSDDAHGAPNTPPNAGAPRVSTLPQVPAHEAANFPQHVAPANQPPVNR
ncbi:MAG TPA: hypothetical protein VGN72_21825 [Tepidisphaeraceae bacterium]|nr:hypothetical protein [Tepidisphaeraceae bacterium]